MNDAGDGPRRDERMNAPKINMASLALAGLGALVTIAAFIHAGGAPALLSGYTLWALGPYLLLGGSCFLSRGLGSAIATLAVTALATVSAVVIYSDALFIEPGSFSGLVLLFVPFYQLIAAIILLAVVLIARLRARRRKA